MTPKELVTLVLLLLKYIRVYDMSHRKRDIIHEIAHDALRIPLVLVQYFGDDLDAGDIPF